MSLDSMHSSTITYRCDSTLVVRKYTLTQNRLHRIKQQTHVKLSHMSGAFWLICVDYYFIIAFSICMFEKYEHGYIHQESLTVSHFC